MSKPIKKPLQQSPHGLSDATDVARMSATATALRVVLGQLKRRLSDEMRPGGLTASQISVIAHLARNECDTVSALAKTEGMRPQSMGAIVTSLQTAGLIAGTPDPNDGRRTVLTLTKTAFDLIAASRAAKEDWLFQSIQSRLTPAEQATLADAVELLERLVAK